MSGLLDDRAGVSEGEEEPVSGEDVPTRRADRASGADELPENESGDEEEDEDEDEDEESADDSSEEEEVGAGVMAGLVHRRKGSVATSSSPFRTLTGTR